MDGRIEIERVTVRVMQMAISAGDLAAEATMLEHVPGWTLPWAKRPAWRSPGNGGALE